jgi:hypothetical protein
MQIFAATSRTSTDGSRIARRGEAVAPHLGGRAGGTPPPPSTPAPRDGAGRVRRRMCVAISEEKAEAHGSQ